MRTPARRDHLSALFSTLLAASFAAADVLYVVSNTTNQVHVMNVPPVGAPSLISTMNSAEFVRPYGIGMRANGDLLVNSRGPCTGCVGGGLTKMIGSGCGQSQSGGATSSAGLRNPHDVVVMGDLAYMADSYNSRIARYSLSAPGAPVPIGNTTANVPPTGGRGIVIHPGLGELFLSDCCQNQNIRRFRIETDGSLTPAGVISGNSLASPHNMAVSDEGELFVCNLTGAGSISRFRFNASGAAVPSGVITGAGVSSAVSITFASWGEMLVVSHAAPTVRRFTFDGAGNAVHNGSFAIPTPGGDSIMAGTLPAFVARGEHDVRCVGDSTSFTVVGAAGAGLSFQWRHNGVPLDNNANPSAATAMLSLPAVLSGDAGVYDCMIDTGCGNVATAGVPLTVCKCAACSADFNDDGGIDGGDVSAFFEAWESGHCDADVNADGGIDGGDVSTFFGQWENGGC